MGDWRERALEAARQAAQTEADARNKILRDAYAAQEAARLAEEAVAQAAEAERKRQRDERYAFSTKKAKAAESFVRSLDRLQIEKTLEAIRGDVWEGRGRITVKPTYFDGTMVGKTVALTAEVPTHARLVTQDIYRMVQRWDVYTHYGSMGEPSPYSRTTYHTPKEEAAGTKVTGVTIDHVPAVLAATYGYDHELIKSEEPLPNTGVLGIHFQNSNGKNNKYERNEPRLLPYPTVDLINFTNTSLALACAELLKDPFSAQIARAQGEAERLTARIGDQWNHSITDGRVIPTVGDRLRTVRDLLRRG